MRRMKPMSMLIALIMLLIFFFGGMYMVTKPSSHIYKETHSWNMKLEPELFEI